VNPDNKNDGKSPSPPGGFIPDEPSAFDQADGFSGQEEDARSRRRREAFAAAAAATGDTHDAVWHELFALQQAAAGKNWDNMRRLLSEERRVLPFHAFSLTAFSEAAAAGRVDIAAAMTQRGFRLPAEEGGDALTWLATRHAPASLPVIDYMLQNRLAPPETALSALAAMGAPAAMEVFRRAGCDIFQGGESFSTAFHQGNTDMMTYLAGQGAELCGAGVAQGLYGGVNKSAAESPTPINVSHTLATCRQLLAADRAKSLAQYEKIAAKPPATLAEFRAPVPGSVPGSVPGLNPAVTLLQLAAHAGKFGDVLAAAAETAEPLCAQDLLQSGKNGASALTTLAVYGEQAAIFEPRAWFRAPEGAQNLLTELKNLGADAGIDLAGFAAGVQRCRLKEAARRAPWPPFRK
jgi:hypothetical protein